MKKYLETKDQAIDLRKRGYSYGYISERTGKAKSTLYHWLANVPYTPNKYTLTTIGEARARSGQTMARQKLESINKAKRDASKEIGILSKRDIFMLGIALYIGEGTKSHDIVRVINSNPAVIRLAVKWFKESLSLKNENFSLRIHLYPDNDIKQSISFWSKQTGIPKNQFSKTQIDTRSSKKISKRGKLPYGTAHLSVKSTEDVKTGVFLARKINAYMDIVMGEDAGIV